MIKKHTNKPKKINTKHTHHKGSEKNEENKCEKWKKTRGSTWNILHQSTEKCNFTVISLHHCTISCGKIPHEACFSAWQVFYRWIWCCSRCVWWRSVLVRSQAWRELSCFSCSSRVAGFLNYLPVDYDLHAAGFGIFHLHPAVQAFLSSCFKKKQPKTNVYLSLPW